MFVPIICFGCGKVIAHLLPLFKKAISQGQSPAEALLQFNTQWETSEKHVHCLLRACCSRSILGVDERGHYLQVVERVERCTP